MPSVLSPTKEQVKAVMFHISWFPINVVYSTFCVFIFYCIGNYAIEIYVLDGQRSSNCGSSQWQSDRYCF